VPEFGAPQVTAFRVSRLSDFHPVIALLGLVVQSLAQEFLVAIGACRATWRVAIGHCSFTPIGGLVHQLGTRGSRTNLGCTTRRNHKDVVPVFPQVSGL